MTSLNKRDRNGSLKSNSKLLRINWYKKQHLAFEENEKEYEGKGFLVKQGPYLFGCAPCMDEFVMRYMERKEDLEMYELIHGPCKLTLDVEMCIPNEPEPENVQKWLYGIINPIKSICSASSIIILNNCRKSTNGANECYKLSFHIVFCEIVFLSIADMKIYVHSKIVPLFSGNVEYTWIHHKKNGEVSKIAIDSLIYTQNRAFRIAFAHKGDPSKGRMEPWDLENWCKKDLAHEDNFIQYMCDSFVSTDDTDNAIQIEKPVHILQK